MKISPIQNTTPYQQSNPSKTGTEKQGSWSKANMIAAAIIGIGTLGLGIAIGSYFRMPPVQGPNPPFQDLPREDVTPPPQSSNGEDMRFASSSASSGPLPWSQMNVSEAECEKVLKSRPNDLMTKVARAIDKVQPFCKLPMIGLSEYLDVNKMTAPIMRGFYGDKPGIALRVEANEDGRKIIYTQTMFQMSPDSMFLNPTYIRQGEFDAFCEPLAVHGRLPRSTAQFGDWFEAHFVQQFTKFIKEGLGNSDCGRKLAHTVDPK